MPTALSLQVLMKTLHESSDEKLAELTKLSLANIKRCRILLSFSDRFQSLMLDPDPAKRVKANFFIELHPVLDLYDEIGKPYNGGRTRTQLIDHFLSLYRAGKIKSVIEFRKILSAHEFLKDDEDRFEEFLGAMRTIASETTFGIKKLFDPLMAEDKAVADAEAVCTDFLTRLKKMKVSHATNTKKLQQRLASVRDYVEELLQRLEGAEQS
jgi:hypothetical protein